MKRFLAGVFCAVLLLSLMGCASEPEQTGPTETTAPPPTARELYAQSCNSLLSAPNRILTYTATQTRTVSGQTYTQSASGTASCSGLGTDAVEAMVKETLSYGSLSTEHVLTYCGGQAYSQLSGCTFGKEMTPEDFYAELLPAVLLDGSLYQQVQQQTCEEGIILDFSQPLALEQWAPNAAYAELEDASGTATVNTDGVLSAATYTARYTCGSTDYVFQVSVRISTPAALDLAAVHPSHADVVYLECLEAPRVLMQAVGDIFSARYLQCDISETVYSQAIPLQRSRQTSASVSGLGTDIQAVLANTIRITDYRNQTTESSQEYRFAAGSCTASVNGEEPVIQPDITADSMRTGVEDTILAGLFANGYLAGAARTKAEGTYTLHFTGNDAYCTDLSGDIGSFLGMDLEGLATEAQTTEAAGYLTVDISTGLPTAMGISLARTHTVSDTPYELTYTLDQTLRLTPEV